MFYVGGNFSKHMVGDRAEDLSPGGTVLS
jgi:hypothetical protein